MYTVPVPVSFYVSVWHQTKALFFLIHHYLNFSLDPDTFNTNTDPKGSFSLNQLVVNS